MEQSRRINDRKIIDFFLSIPLAIVWFILKKKFLISLLIVVIGFIVYCILNSVAEKPINAAFEKEQKEMQQKQKKRLEEAEKADEDALTRQQEDCDAAYDAVIAKNQDKLDALEAEMEAAQKEFNEITLLSQADLEKDLGLIKKVLELMEGSRADSVKEAFRNWIAESAKLKPPAEPQKWLV